MSALYEIPARTHATVHVNAERCAGCQECVIRCPTHALSINVQAWIAEADESLCVGCRQCERVCPFSAISVTGPRVVASRSESAVLTPLLLAGSTDEIRAGFRGWSAAAAEADRCLRCPDPTCIEGCPAHIDIPGLMGALQERSLDRAYEVLSRSTILPEVCSRVCDQSVQCEGACSWALAGGQAVAIGRLERFVADYGPEPEVVRRSAEGAGVSVAVVGGGPAGCAAAWELLAASAEVTMIEKDSRIGGVLDWGIPSFTLPDATLERRLGALLKGGLILRSGCELGRDVDLDELLATHDAVVLAHGASRPISLSVPGIELAGVEDATSFLKRAKTALSSGEQLPDFGPGTRVLVLGGGNTAMDVARTLRRFGAEAMTAEWMDERFSRVRPDELAEARSEGVDVRFSTTLERLDGDEDGVRVAWLRNTRQRHVNERPVVLSGGEPICVPVDGLIVALGYRVDPSVTAGVVTLPLPALDQSRAVVDRRWTASGIPTGQPFAVGTPALQREVGLAVAGSPLHQGWWARLWPHPAEVPGLFRSSWWARLWKRQASVGMAAAVSPQVERVWVAGDALVGPSTVSGSMAQGREAARAVLRMRPRRPAA